MLKKLFWGFGAVFLCVGLASVSHAAEDGDITPAVPSPSEMVNIPGGEFMAGMEPDLALDECRKYDSQCERSWFTNARPHPVVVEPFSIDKYEVTQEEFLRVMGSNPSQFKGDNLPVDSVLWKEAVEYCKRAGKRLPTEWEWEKAAKGGTSFIYMWGDNPNDFDRYAWIDKNSDSKTHPVGQKKPNGYGLHDMAGNVYEWTASDYNSRKKVLRGGAWNGNASLTSPANRSDHGPGMRHDYYGFRCVK